MQLIKLKHFTDTSAVLASTPSRPANNNMVETLLNETQIVSIKEVPVTIKSSLCKAVVKITMSNGEVFTAPVSFLNRFKIEEL